MADSSAATENMVTPENLSTKLPNSSEPASARTNDEVVCAEAHSNNEPSMSEFRTNEPRISSETNEEPLDLKSRTEDHQLTTDVRCVREEIRVEEEPREKEITEVEIKKEFDEGISSFTDDANQIRQTDENSCVGKLKIKPMASLVETNPTNPQPGMHPFFAGFDDHIRSLIMNRQPQFSMTSPLMQRPAQFMYYDNSTNMNLKNMLNGHKVGQVPVTRPAYRPYVPINVPRPPRSQIPFRTTFSTQTPPMFIGQPTVSATPSTSRQWLPQSRPPMQNFTPQDNSPGRNFTSQKNFAVPNFTSANNSTNPKFTSSNFTTPDLTSTKEPAPKFPSLQNPSVPNSVPLHANKVSTSSSTDDLEKHSNDNRVIIKTEVDLGIDSKEELQATVNECNLAAHFTDTTDSSIPTPSNATVKLEIADITPQQPILTGDDVAPPAKEVPKRNSAYDLPAYSTKGCLLCKCCDFRCNRRKKMKEHFDSMHTAENHYKCFYCVKKLLPIFSFKTVHDLEHHVGKVHRREKRWQCRSCTKTYKCQASYKAHVEKTCSQSHPYACHMCTFTCHTEAALEKHIRSHEKLQETHQCPFCHKFFKRFYMKQHLLTVHAPPEEKPFHCVSCDYATGTQAVLDSHYKRTGHDRLFKCAYCDYSSKTQSTTKAHVRASHTDGKLHKFLCGVDGCQMKCVTERNLKLHRQTHTLPESELFVCPEKDCLMKFTLRQSLRLHILKTRHNKPFKCTDCTLRFLKEESLNRHIQSVHVKQLLKKMENPYPQEAVHVRNVVDVFNYVESGGMGGASSFKDSQSKDDSAANFGCWLGISGFGDVTDKTDCDLQDLSQAVDSEVSGNKDDSQEKKMESDEDENDDYQNLVPLTCLVELKQEDVEDNSNSSVGKTDDGFVSLKREEEDEDTNDSEYQHVNPELSCLVECQQNATADSSTGTNFNENERQEIDSLPTNLVKIEVEEMDDS